MNKENEEKNEFKKNVKDMDNDKEKTKLELETNESNNTDNKSEDEIVENTFELNEKETNKKHTKFIIVILIVIILLISGYILDQKYNLTDFIDMNFFKIGLKIETINLENNTMNIAFNQPIITKKRWYRILLDDGDITEWIEITKENKIEVKENMKYIQIKDEKNEGEKLDIADYLNVVYELNVKTTLNKIMLTKGEVKELEIEAKCIGNPVKNISISTDDESIIKLENNTITALEPGKANLIVKDNFGHVIEIPVTVTDLITLPEIKENKEFLTRGKVYTEEEAHLLDELLDYKVKEAGEGTRAAVIAVAKFITMEFKYKIPYFFENGRYQKNDFSRPCDGEGRYYHKGLYLSEDKYESIKDSRTGPAMWGTPIRELSTGTTRCNGLDCSGFVSWALYNAGFDPGDIGAGPDDNYASIPEYGKEYDLTVDILKSRNNKEPEI